MEDEMGGACSRCAEEVRCMDGFGGETWKDTYHSEDSGVDGMLLLKWNKVD